MRFGRTVVLTIVIFLASSAFVSADDKAPDKVIEEFHAALLAVMKEAKSLSAQERYTRLEPAVTAAFNLGLMIRVASGTAWRKTGEDQKKQLTSAFHRLSVANYAFRFKGYSGQKFETLKTDDGPRKMRLVYTQIVSPKKKKKDRVVKLTYVTKKFENGWRIVDILLAGGISELAVKHSEYRTILRSKGAGALAKMLNKKADQLIAG